MYGRSWRPTFVGGELRRLTRRLLTDPVPAHSRCLCLRLGYASVASATFLGWGFGWFCFRALVILCGLPLCLLGLPLAVPVALHVLASGSRLWLVRNGLKSEPISKSVQNYSRKQIPYNLAGLYPSGLGCGSRRIGYFPWLGFWLFCFGHWLSCAGCLCACLGCLLPSQ